MAPRASALSLLLAPLGLFAACGGEDPPPPPPTILKVTVTDAATGMPIQGAQLVIVDYVATPVPAAQALTARVAIQPTGSAGRLHTDATGAISAEVGPGRYVFRVQAGGYLPSPEALDGFHTLTVAPNVTTTFATTLEPRPVPTGAGAIAGTVRLDGVPRGGVLVVAASTSVYSTVTDDQGVFVLLGLPTNIYRVEAFHAGFKGDALANVDVGSTELPDQDFGLTANAGSTITATIGAGAGTTSVAVALRATGDLVPGSVTPTAFGGQAVIAGLPPGQFTVVAALEKDGRVVSPDLLRLRTPPNADVTAEEPHLVPLPMAPAVEGLTVDTSTVQASARFSWTAVAGAAFYVVEVRDMADRVLWGGLDARGQTQFRVRAPATSVNYGDLSPATDQLVSGRSYKLRVFAGREVPATGTYELMAASELREGRFKVR